MLAFEDHVDDVDDQAAGRALVLQLLDDGLGVTLEDLLGRPPWHAAGACVGHDSAIFFPDDVEDVARAQAICERCPVRQPCQEWALEQGRGLEGVWGGLSEVDRQRLRWRGRATKVRRVKGALPQETRAALLPDHGTEARYRRHECRCETCVAGHLERASEQRARAEAKRGPVVDGVCACCERPGPVTETPAGQLDAACRRKWEKVCRPTAEAFEAWAAERRAFLALG